MANADGNCSKCKGRMEEGFALDKAHYNAATVASWTAGPSRALTRPQRWFGDPLRNKQRWQISGFRCTSCGYLELYAK